MEALKDADDVFVLGWSIPRTDKDQEKLIRAVVRSRKEPFRRVVVVNWHATKSYYSRVAAIFGVSERSLVRYDKGLQGFLAQPAAP